MAFAAAGLFILLTFLPLFIYRCLFLYKNQGALMWLEQPYAEVFRQTPKPFAFVDMAAWRQNFADLVARCGHKRIRIATKSIRCPDLMRTLAGHPQVDGWLCFSADEALYLAGLGFNNLLVAYPTLEPPRVTAVCRAVQQGAQIVLMADSAAHLRALNRLAAAAGAVLPVALDIDVSVAFPGIYFGVYRSSLRQAADLRALLAILPDCPALKLCGVMTYEAQIAGVTDAHNGKNGAYNALVRLLKRRSLPHIRAWRQEITQILQASGVELAFFNGGGTGSLASTLADAAVTELTFGSGLFAPALFDGYQDFQPRPAAGFALEIVRRPRADVYTCLGGGYMASGSSGRDKLPLLMYPRGRLLANEGAGEVQTPFRFSGSLDWPQDNFALFRHAKAGELCERFNELLLLDNGTIAGRAKTYRGDGQCFL